jgi:hypothetical protein
MEKIDETRPLRRSDADLQPLWPKLWMRTGHDEIDANEKILAIGTINPGVDPAKVFAVLPNEVRDTVDLYLNGKIDQWYSQQERRGVVFILNVTDPAAARDMLEKLPLGQAHLMSFELIPIGPLNPLRQLQGMKANP